MARVRLSRYEVEEDDLPPVCMRCGAPAVERVSKAFAWHPPWVLVLLIAGLLPFAIVAFVLTKRMTIRAPLCAAHRNHWFSRLLFTWLSFVGLAVLGVAAVVLMVESGDRRSGGGMSWLAGLACAGATVGLLAWVIATVTLQLTSIRPTEITDRSILLTGVAREFLEALEDEQDRRDYGRPRRHGPDGGQHFYAPDDFDRRRPSSDAFREGEP